MSSNWPYECSYCGERTFTFIILVDKDERICWLCHDEKFPQADTPWLGDGGSWAPTLEGDTAIGGE